MQDVPIILSSAFRHGLSREDILHAYRNPIRVLELNDRFTMLIGANRAAILLEIGYREQDSRPVIVHAMHARPKFLR